MGGCVSNEKPYSVAADSTEVVPVVQFYEAATDYRERGRRLIHIRAALQEELPNQDRRFPKGIHIEHMDSAGEAPIAYLTAEEGYFYAEDELYLAERNVALYHLQKAETLLTERLYWDPRVRQVYTDTFLRIHAIDEMHTGHGLTAAEDFSTYEIQRPTGRIKR